MGSDLKAHNLAFSWHSPLPSCNSPKVAKKTSFILGEKNPYKLSRPKPIKYKWSAAFLGDWITLHKTRHHSEENETNFLQLQAQWSATPVPCLGVSPFSKWLMVVVCQLTMVLSRDKHASNRSRFSISMILANWRKLFFMMNWMQWQNQSKMGDQPVCEVHLVGVEGLLLLGCSWASAGLINR